MGSFAAALAALALATPPEVAPATVVGAPPPAVFTCRGTETAQMPPQMAGGGRRSVMKGMGSGMGARAMSRMNAGASRGKRVKSTIELMVAGKVVKVRPSEGLAPMMGAKPADGWYQLEEVVISDTQVQGKAPWGMLYTPRLLLQKADGQVTFGVFTGACENQTEAVVAASEKDS